MTYRLGRVRDKNSEEIPGGRHILVILQGLDKKPDVLLAPELCIDAIRW
jgi:hypothetical protein